jgi:hypothetical protein
MSSGRRRRHARGAPRGACGGHSASGRWSSRSGSWPGRRRYGSRCARGAHRSGGVASVVNLR